MNLKTACHLQKKVFLGKKIASDSYNCQTKPKIGSFQRGTDNA